jgi:hypothetical protein
MLRKCLNFRIVMGCTLLIELNKRLNSFILINCFSNIVLVIYLVEMVLEIIEALWLEIRYIYLKVMKIIIVVVFMNLIMIIDSLYL